MATKQNMTQKDLTEVFNILLIKNIYNSILHCSYFYIKNALNK